MHSTALRIAALALIILAVAASAMSAPTVRFNSEGVSVADLKPGTKLVWLALTRRSVGYHNVLGTVMGTGVATPAGVAGVAHAGADRSRSLWLLATIDGEFATTTAPAGYESSLIPIEVTATRGATDITIVTPSVELLYVRPHGGAWQVSAADGGNADADGKHDARITLSLQSLQPFQGNPRPPESMAEGDLILMIDPMDNRVAVVRVSR